MSGGRSREAIVRSSLSLARRQLDALTSQTKRAAAMEAQLARLPATSQEADTLRRRLRVLTFDLEERTLSNAETVDSLLAICRAYNIAL
jgi:uncharacterized protein YigA (DUF484 family)